MLNFSKGIFPRKINQEEFFKHFFLGSQIQEEISS